MSEAAKLQKIEFSSESLPAELNDRARFSLWHDIYSTNFREMTINSIAEEEFSARMEILKIGEAIALRSDSTVDGIARTPRNISMNPSSDYCITFNSGSAPWVMSQRGRDQICATGDGAFFTTSEPVHYRSAPRNSWISLAMSGQRLRELIPNVDDLLQSPLNLASEPMRYLRSQLTLLLGMDGIGGDPLLVDHIERSLFDLAALALGVGGDAAELARMRGLRAARTQSILAEIRINFANPAFSPGEVARKLGISPRYINELLAETGSNFTDRMNELRLQKARKMLSSPGQDYLKVSDIAIACGFNEVSYFNRRFRARFGASPTQYRGGGEVPDAG